MKKGWYISLIIVFCLFFIDRIGGFFLLKINSCVKVGNNVGGKLNYYLSQNCETEVLLMGDSRMEYGVIPDSLGKRVFNLAHYGKMLDFNACLLDILKSKRRLPKKVILGVDPYLFLSSTECPSFSSSAILRQYFNSSSLVRKYILTTSNDKYLELKWASYLYRYNSAVPTLLLNYFKTLRGDSIENKGFNYFEFNAMDSVRVNFAVNDKIKLISNYTNNVTSSKLDILKEIIRECRINGIDLVLIIPPNKYFVEDKYSIGVSCLRKLVDQSEIPMLDFSCDMDLMNMIYWSDSEHLNIVGARLFSSKLKRELIKINFQI